MSNFFIRLSLIIAVVSHFGYANAVDGCKEEDLKLSKKSFLISDMPYNQDYQEPEGESKIGQDGVMTLCFEGNDNVALIFEYFSPKDPGNISISMARYGKDDCCSVGSKVAHLDSDRFAILKVHGGVKISPSTGEKVLVPPTYAKYASWVLPNEDLLMGVGAVEKEVNLSNHSSDVVFIREIMRATGLRNVDFGLWRHTYKNLKILTRDYISPKPSKLAK